MAIELSTIAAGTGGFVVNGETAPDKSGWSVAAAGDINGDGLADLLVGAPSAAVGFGRTYVVYGRTGGTVALTDIAGVSGGFVAGGTMPTDTAGNSVSGIGDVNGDGFDDFLVGAPHNALAGPNAGRAFVVFGGSGLGNVDLADVAAGSGGFAIDAPAAASYVGWSVSGTGDVNGDGIADLIVSAWNESASGRTYSGRSYVVFGKGGTAAVELTAVAGGTGGFVINGAGACHYSGRSVSGAGDVNGGRPTPSPAGEPRPLKFPAGRPLTP